MTRYDTYKDSGVQWLGEIPGHWKSTTLGRMLHSKLSYGASESGELEWSDGSMRYIRITDITLDGKLKTEGAKYLPFEIGKDYIVDSGDVLFARSGATVGKAFIYKSDKLACYAGYLIKASVKQEDILPDFLFYYTQSCQYEEWKNRIFIQATIQNISAEKYARMNICIPPLSEQHAIVSYLDDKCGKIDKLLEGKQKQIDLLTETKQRIIADAVTRGLNPTVKMKPTNISWLPEIPEHWTVSKVMYFFDVQLGKMLQPQPKAHSDRPTQYLCAVHVGKNKLKYLPERTMWANDDDIHHYGIKKGDLLVVEGGDVGSCAILEDDIQGYIIQNALHRVRSKNNCQIEILQYLLNTAKYNGYLERICSKATIAHFTKEKLQCFNIAVPPLSEQRSIVSYIESRTSKIDLLADKLHQEIEAIKEYKQRLISDVVTGQIKVC